MDDNNNIAVPSKAWGDDPTWAREDSSFNNNNSKENGDSSEDAENNGVAYFGAQHTLILIDCSSSMFQSCVIVEKDEDDDDNSSVTTEEGGEEDSRISPFDAALKAAEMLLKTQVKHVATSKTGKRDGVGVMLYNTKRRRGDSSSNNGAGYTSTYELIPIAPPGIEQVLQIGKCLVENKKSCSSLPNSPVFMRHPSCSSEKSPFAAAVTSAISSGSELRRVSTPGRERDLRDEFEDVNNDQLSASDIAVRMGNQSLCSLRSALHDAIKLFANAKCVKRHSPSSQYPKDIQTIWIFTNNDDPCHGNNDERKLVINVAKDAVDNGLEIQVKPLPRASPPLSLLFENEASSSSLSSYNHSNNNTDSSFGRFDRNKFYNYITTKDSLNYTDHTSSLAREERLHIMNLQDFLMQTKQQSKRVRRLFCIPFLFPGDQEKKEEDGASIMLDFFRLVQVQRKPQPVFVHQETNKMTFKTTQTLSIDTGKIITPNQIRTFIEFGNEPVPITKEEIGRMKQQSHSCQTPNLTLLGFKPIHSIPLHYNIELPYFVYPNDEMVGGSREAFVALYIAMREKGVVGIGELVTRVTSVARLVAIFPQSEERREITVTSNGDDDDDDEDNYHGARSRFKNITEQITPPGFIVVPLPFEDDVRKIAEKEDKDGSSLAVSAADEESVKAAEIMIKCQQVEGVEWGTDFVNPALNSFWSYIESVALGTPLPSSMEYDDDTKMNTDDILRSAGDEIDAFRDILPKDDDYDDDDEQKVRRNKRKRKVVLMDTADYDVSELDWANMCKMGKLEECSVALLKQYLRSEGLKVGGRKADLIERVEENLEGDS